MKAYVDILGDCAQQFKFITITCKPRSEIRYTDAVAFLLAAPAIGEERTHDIGIQHKLNIYMPVDQYRDMYVTVVIQSMSKQAP